MVLTLPLPLTEKLPYESQYCPSVSFSVFDYQPIRLHTIYGEESIAVPNPPYVQFPLIKNVCEHLQGVGVCECTSISATPVNWVLDRVLGKF